MLQAFIDRVCRLFVSLMVVCLALMVVMVFGNVVLRYGFNSGITASEELSRWLFVWMIFLGAVVALHDRAHLGTDALVARLPMAGRRLCRVAAHLLMLGVCWLMLHGAWQQTVITYRTSSAVMEIPMAGLYGSSVLFALLATLIIVHELWKLATGQPDHDRPAASAEAGGPPHGDPQASASDATKEQS
ncbi:TRAP transporter small permease [Schlegelella sp. S2-27]|uniref:TRAP transporter small permease protein n=1 Tax=Caldimonas mangrovi TaxID=2944811 RepID=A0ABT0YNS5_9BURK|nr:TRAP transporter small permease [Caldimonas mangrovi]MCM5680380.1 TRAP transporter small permease [Caldimonas mangrovi]